MMEPWESVALRAGHRELLATLRELTAEAGDPDAEADPEALRATLAFLRQGVVPFARREEALLVGDPPVWEGAALEHAFLEAEIDRLAAEAAVLFGAAAEGAEGARVAARRVRRTLDRIEAVLELHLEREGERPITTGAAGVAAHASSSVAVPDPGLAPGQMTPNEAERFLRERPWGVLSTLGVAQPYGVPVHYGFDGRCIYFATGPGRKADNLAGSPAVCLTVPEITDGTRWRCVVVTGNAQAVESLADRAAAVRSLARSAGAGFQVSSSALKRLAAARLYRITPAEITGRQRGG